MKILEASDKVAVIFKDQRISYRELLQKAYQFSQLSCAAVEDRCLIFSENRLEWVYAFYACWQSKAIPVPVDAASTSEEVAYILKDCRPASVFCSESNVAKVRSALELSGISTQVLVFEQMQVTDQVPSEQQANIAEPPSSDVAVIVYTSGTTGSPKGVMLTFQNIWANLHSVSAEVPIYCSDDRVMVLLPLHHVLPLQGTMLMPLTIGATIVFAPSLVAADILSTLSDHKVTLFVGVPRLFILLRDGLMSKIRQKKIASFLFFLCARINSLAFSRLLFGTVQRRFGGAIKYMPCGGAAIDPQVIKDFRTLGFEILLGYGLTETAPMVSFTHPGGGRKGASGQIMPCNEVRCVDGEIAVRGGNVMKGYFERPEETAAVLRDGWFYTGDLGHVDKDGHIFITGRRKEIIVLPSGKNINPEEIEQKLLKYTDFISEVAVLASGDALQALILPNVKALQARGIINLEEAIRADAVSKYNQNASSYKRILKCIMISESLPRTRLGKLKRYELAALAENNRQRKNAATPEPDLEEYRVIKEFLEGQTGQEIYPEDHFELDLSLDSLGKVSFQVFLSGTFGLEVNEQTLLEFPTPRNLAEHMHCLSKTMSADKHFKWGEVLREKVSVKLPRSWVTFHWMNLCSGFFLRCFFRLRGENIENVPEGACILAPNHQSYLDSLFIMAFLKKKILQDTFFYAKAEHVRHWWQRFMANRHNVIVMDINKDLKLSLQKLADVLKKNKKVIIFPEGTRTLDGNLGDFKHTFAILGRELDVPIVPIAVDGAFKVLPRGRKIPHFFRKVNVSFLPPIYPENNDSYSSLSEKVHQALSEKLEKI
ncbi:MAG: AMP-binding protein [Lentisphaeria bacterium]